MNLEKEKLPKLRFKEFNEEIVNIIFEEVIEDSGYGPRFNSNDYNEHGNVKTIRGTDISSSGEINYEQVPLARLDDILVSNHQLQDGDLVMITTADCGLTGVFRKQNIAYIPSAYAVKIKLKKSANPYFFQYFFQTSKAKNQVSKFIRKATVANLPGSDILKFKINLPSITEQQKIAAFFTAIDNKIQLLTRKKTLLEKYKKSVSQKLFNQEIRFKDDTGGNYEYWKKQNLSEVLVEHKERNKTSQYEEVFSVAKEKGVINQIEHLGRSYASNIIENYKVVYPFDIIYTKSPTSDFPFGIIKQNKLGRTGVVSVLYAVFKPNNGNIGYIIDDYFSSGINAYNYLNPLVRRGAKNTMNISNDEFLNGVKLSLPVSPGEQEKFASFLMAMNNRIILLATQLQKMQAFKKGLLQQMFV